MMMRDRKFLLGSILCFVLALGVGGIAWGQPVDAGVTPDADVVFDPEDAIEDNVAGVNDDPGAAIKKNIEDWKAGNWELAIGGLIMLLTWAMKRFFWKTLPNGALIWVALALGMLSDGARILALGQGWLEAIIGGILAGGSAAMLWTTLGKRILPSEKPDKLVS
jgi:hypothetical protein